MQSTGRRVANCITNGDRLVLIVLIPDLLSFLLFPGYDIPASSMIEIRVAPELKSKCPKASLGCVEATVESRPTPTELDALLRAAEERVVKLADPRAILEAPAVLATRAGYKALGKDPS